MKKWTKNNQMNQLEHAEQVNLMKWWALACRAYQLDERMLFAIPNGGQRNIIVAAKMKQEGASFADALPRPAASASGQMSKPFESISVKTGIE